MVGVLRFFRDFFCLDFFWDFFGCFCFFGLFFCFFWFGKFLGLQRRTAVRLYIKVGN